MESSVVFVLEIGNEFIPCMRMLQVINVYNVHDHLVEDLCLAISLGMESCGLGELGVQH